MFGNRYVENLVAFLVGTGTDVQLPGLLLCTKLAKRYTTKTRSRVLNVYQFDLCDDRGGTRWRGWRPVGFGLTERRTTRLMEHAKCGFLF